MSTTTKINTKPATALATTTITTASTTSLQLLNYKLLQHKQQHQHQQQQQPQLQCACKQQKYQQQTQQQIRQQHYPQEYQQQFKPKLKQNRHTIQKQQQQQLKLQQIYSRASRALITPTVAALVWQRQYQKQHHHHQQQLQRHQQQQQHQQLAQLYSQSPLQQQTQLQHQFEQRKHCKRKRTNTNTNRSAGHKHATYPQARPQLSPAATSTRSTIAARRRARRTTNILPPVRLSTLQTPSLLPTIKVCAALTLLLSILHSSAMQISAAVVEPQMLQNFLQTPQQQQRQQRQQREEQYQQPTRSKYNNTSNNNHNNYKNNNSNESSNTHQQQHQHQQQKSSSVLATLAPHPHPQHPQPHATMNHTLKSFSFIDDGLTAEMEMADATADANSLPIFDFGMPRNITGRTGQTEAIIKCRVDRLNDKSVSWIRKRDLHILTVGTATYTSDKRFEVTTSKDAREWTLHVKAPLQRDSGIYECQVNTEPKMSMAFQLNVIEISPDAKAIISGPHDLHFKVGSAIILNCLVQQPSVKDIGPIYWYRGEHMITPFDLDDEHELAGAAQHAKHHRDTDALHAGGSRTIGGTAASISDGIAAVAAAAEDLAHDLTNDITHDFTARIAMESQLGDTLKSRLRISNAQTTDTGNYTCQPTTASSASVMVHVINDETPAAMQKSKAASLHGFPFWAMPFPNGCRWFRKSLHMPPAVVAAVVVVVVIFAILIAAASSKLVAATGCAATLLRFGLKRPARLLLTSVCCAAVATASATFAAISSGCRIVVAALEINCDVLGLPLQLHLSALPLLVILLLSIFAFYVAAVVLHAYTSASCSLLLPATEHNSKYADYAASRTNAKTTETATTSTRYTRDCS